MEIERKWMVEAWPTDLPLLFEQTMRQGYICVTPTVRIREEAETSGNVAYVLCFKSKGLLSRKEIEMEISKETFAELEDLIGRPLIPKTRRTYQLSDGLHLEVSLVDEGMSTQFMYAEVEYKSEEQAMAWHAGQVGLSSYLSDEVTGMPGQSMGAYWLRTRGDQSEQTDQNE